MARVPLTSFGVKNFKAFNSLQEVPVRPITILFGRNNCGKSALLRSLVHGAEMMRAFDPETIDEDALDELDFTQDALKRAGADIGAYPDYLHARAQALVGFAYTLEPTPSASLSELTLGTISNLGLRCEFAFDDRAEDDDGLSWGGLLRTTAVLLCDGRPLIRNGALDCDHPLAASLIEWAAAQSLGAHRPPSWRQDVTRLLEGECFVWTTPPAFPPQLSFNFLTEEHASADPTSVEPFRRLQDEQTHQMLSQRIGRGLHREEITELSRLANVVCFRTVQIYNESLRTLRKITREQLYIGPLRGVPESVWALNGPETQGMPFWRILAEDDDARAAVNAQLGRIVGDDDPVRVHVEQFGSSIPLAEAHIDKLATALLPQAEERLRAALESTMESETRKFDDLPGIEPAELANQWAREIVRSSSTLVKAEVRIESGRTSRLLPASQVGLGLSQMIPVVAAAMTATDRLLLVEQPELHLHPAMQAELGDLFIESALGDNQNTWIIETHSEHLLLRLMRRIRETTHGRLPQGVRGLTPQDVSVCFIEKDQGVSRVFPIPLDENGMITRPWPGGFFEEGFREVMAW